MEFHRGRKYVWLEGWDKIYWDVIWKGVLKGGLNITYKHEK